MILIIHRVILKLSDFFEDDIFFSVLSVFSVLNIQSPEPAYKSPVEYRMLLQKNVMLVLSRLCTVCVYSTVCTTYVKSTVNRYCIYIGRSLQ
jgi:hypothetical protein